jgi:hypothetical protein
MNAAARIRKGRSRAPCRRQQRRRRPAQAAKGERETEVNDFDENGPTGLVRYAMCRAIEVAHSLDEIMPIRDLAAQLAAAAKIAKNYEAERKCREIRVRAERKAGQLLAEMAGSPLYS